MMCEESNEDESRRIWILLSSKNRMLFFAFLHFHFLVQNKKESAIKQHYYIAIALSIENNIQNVVRQKYFLRFTRLTVLSIL